MAELVRSGFGLSLCTALIIFKKPCQNARTRPPSKAVIRDTTLKLRVKYSVAYTAVCLLSIKIALKDPARKAVLTCHTDAHTHTHIATH